MKKYNFILIFLIIFSLNNCNVDFGGKDKLKRKDIIGTVKDKYRSEWQHGAIMIKFQSGNSINEFCVDDWQNRSDLWNYIEIGDSVFKASGSLQLKVIKPNGEIRKYNYDER